MQKQSRPLLVKIASPLQRRARDFIRYVVARTIIAAGETYPEHSVEELMLLCEPALTAELAQEFEQLCHDFVRKTFEAPRADR